VVPPAFIALLPSASGKGAGGEGNLGVRDNGRFPILLRLHKMISCVTPLREWQQAKGISSSGWSSHTDRRLSEQLHDYLSSRWSYWLRLYATKLICQSWF